MKRSVLLAVLLCAGVLAGCGKSSPITAASTAAGPSPFSGRDEAWFIAHPKENEVSVWQTHLFSEGRLSEAWGFGRLHAIRQAQ